MTTRERINEIADELQEIADGPPSEISLNAAQLIAQAAECLGKAAFWPMDRKLIHPCGTIIECGTTEKACKLTSGHDGPHVWGEEYAKVGENR